MKYRDSNIPDGGGCRAQPGGTAVQKRSTSIGLFFAVLFVATLAAAAPEIAGGTPAALPDATVAAGVAATPDSTKKAVEPQQPVRVSADAAEYFNKEGLVVFTGNVVAVQADATIAADRMDVSFEKPAREEGKPAGIGAPSAAQRITMIVAQKKVSLRQVDPETGKERYVTGEKGVYDVDRHLVTMSGNPRLWEGKNLIVGEEMVFYLEEKKVVVKGKVNLTVYPDDLKEVKKP